MIYKAIIQNIMPNEYTAKIRIPVLDKTQGVVGSTENYNLYDAIMCTPPGCSPSYSPGDIVIVAFENNDLSEPIILGCLYRENSTSSINIKSQSLQVEVDAKLPEDTTIGNVDKDSIKSIQGVYNAVATVDYVDEVISNL